MNHSEAQSLLLYALNHYGIVVENTSEGRVSVAGDYEIEVEGSSLYKLLSGGAVVAPFSEVDELCQFIKADQQQRG